MKDRYYREECKVMGTEQRKENNNMADIVQESMAAYEMSVRNPGIDSDTMFKRILVQKDVTVQEGLKFDIDKDQRPGLMLLDFALALQETSKICKFGADKYADHNWSFVDNKKKRYLDALMRHLLAYSLNGEAIDEETGCLEIVHVVWNALAICESELRDSKNLQ